MKILTLISLIFKPKLMLALYNAYQSDPEGVVFANAKTNVIELANPSFLEKNGYTLSELSSKPFFEFIHPDDLEKTLAQAADLQNDGVVTVRFENRYMKKNGGTQTNAWRAVISNGQYQCRVKFKD